MKIGKHIKGFIFWTHSRGSLQYDIMVTLILAFIFLAPRWIDFKDKPAEPLRQHTGVELLSDGKGGSIYVVDASVVRGPDVESDLRRTLEAIAGPVKLVKYEAIYAASGKTVSYRVWVRRP